ncbi:small nuclear ribonucleoprotein [Metallosphaera yellowstonensis MK1]|uniref:Small nuclear ribonucleoprotein n=1 Tax=Metallosphaera yellowstonensis MK1 TaxID=671065 RepID=H2C6B2_9CREN|nr:U6 snRNA-associated Sm-like protein LSm6 [Metallosphaera yellowstonensis]EHP69339.1 small nuclear ribonucleoprotein [Metallosphaera yellowstonensis MK1]
MQAKVENPLKSLRMATNKVVLVKLKDGSEYIGRLEQSDGTMNLVLRDCTELKEGTVDPIAKYGRVLIRGSNILFISVDYENIMNEK